jgi:hypothetical protein
MTGEAFEWFDIRVYQKESVGVAKLALPNIGGQVRGALTG